MTCSIQSLPTWVVVQQKKLFFDDITTGASNDIQNANKYRKRHGYSLWYEVILEPIKYNAGNEMYS